MGCSSTPRRPPGPQRTDQRSRASTARNRVRSSPSERADSDQGDDRRHERAVIGRHSVVQPDTVTSMDEWRPSRFGLEVPVDTAPASWIAPRLRPGTFTVGMTVPEGFEAYARIFFPFEEGVFEGEAFCHRQSVTWKDMARRNGRVVHELMEEETIGPAPGPGERPFRLSGFHRTSRSCGCCPCCADIRPLTTDGCYSGTGTATSTEHPSNTRKG